MGEMMVSGEDLAQLELAHHDETRAVGERELLVVITKEKTTRLLQAGGRDGFPADA